MKNAFTLIEALVTIIIFTLVIGIISGFIVMGYRTQSYALQQSQAIEEARRGIETMVKEIREVNSGDNGFYALEKADNFEFIFYSDIDLDGETERVRYFVEGTNFKKGVTNPEGFPVQYPIDKEKISILSSYVRNSPPIFHYFNGEQSELLPTPARLKDTKLMRVYLVINIDPNRSPEDFVLSSDIQIRNLKINL